MSIVYRTAALSFGVQVITGAITAAAFAVQTREYDTVLILELVSQLVEGVWYLIVLCRYRRILTWTRYLDWFISTPVMLLSLSFLFQIRRGKAIMFTDDMLLVWSLNALMLALGFAVELDVLPRVPGVLAGSLAFVGSFGILARAVDFDDSVSVGLYSVVYAVWGLYGVAALFDDVIKNVGYNLLDVISKNVYGLVLFGLAITHTSSVSSSPPPVTPSLSNCTDVVC